MDDDFYIPMNKLIRGQTPGWTFTSIGLPYSEIAKKGIIMWCVSNLKGHWTMMGGNKFGFEDAADAVIFKMQFGLGA